MSVDVKERRIKKFLPEPLWIWHLLPFTAGRKESGIYSVAGTGDCREPDTELWLY